MKKITKTIKLLILIIILNIVIWGGFYLGFKQIDKIKENLLTINKNIEEKKLEARKEQMMEILSADIKKNEEKIKKHFFSNTDTLRESINIQNIIKNIVENSGVELDGLIKVTEISLVSSQTKKVDGKDVKVVAGGSHISAYRIVFKGRGTWAAVTTLTRKIEKAPFLATVESVSYTSKEDGRWEINMTMTVPSIKK